MPLRFILKYLANNEQLVQKIAESYPVRRAAQLCISIFYRAQNISNDKIPPIGDINKDKISSFINKLKQNVANEWKEGKKQIKDSEEKFKK